MREHSHMKFRVPVTTDFGETVEAQAPVVISASRSTDIPAFYSEWFINRLKIGHVAWYNPFNQKRIYVSFANAKAVVFWSKNPKPLIPCLTILDERPMHYYVQFTLNDYEHEGFEPMLPPLDARIETFRELSDTIGKEKVIWRFDPILATQQHSPRDVLEKVWRIGEKLKGYTDKLVFSFVDIHAYRKVQRNLKSFSSTSRYHASEVTDTQKEEIIVGLVALRERWMSEGWNLSLAACADAKDWGPSIQHNSCIDAELMKQIFSSDAEFLHYLSYGKIPDPKTPALQVPAHKHVNLHDKGQRKACRCMISKDIGMYNTCPHHCAYCYANTSFETVERNVAAHSSQYESIISRNSV